MKTAVIASNGSTALSRSRQSRFLIFCPDKAVLIVDPRINLIILNLSGQKKRAERASAHEHVLVLD